MAFVFANAMPPKETVRVQGWNQTKDYYVVKNFKTHLVHNVNQTIEYYHQKYNTFITAANQKLQKTLLPLLEVSSVEELLEVAIANYNSNVALSWENIQRQSSAELQEKAKEFEKITKSLQQKGETIIQFKEILKHFSTDKTINYDHIPGVVNLNSIQTQLSSFVSYKGDSPRALGGHRSRLFGEIIEQGCGSMIYEQLMGLLGHIQTGDKNSFLPNGTVGQGKTDNMFFVDVSCDGGLTEHAQSFYGTKKGQYLDYSTTTNHSIALEASEIFDLTYGGLQQALNSNVNHYLRGNMMGVNNKAWIGQSGTFGSFSISAQEIRQRKKEGISDWFVHPEEFHIYTAYVVSKYLINIIGVFNGMIATGSQMMPTYAWLYKLYNSGRALRHSDNLKESYGYTNKNWGVKYKISNSLNVSKLS